MSKVTRLTVDSEKGAERRKGHIKDVSDLSGAPLDSVGADLRAARLRLGEDLSSVSDDLRIRREHLEAIENANYGILPGKTYAIGFIRSYAEYLGLDTEALVSRFKEELGVKPENPELVFPEATDEAKLSQGSMVVLALLLAAGIYGGWYLSVSADRMASDRVQPVPDRLSSSPAQPNATTHTTPPTGTTATTAGTQTPPDTTTTPATTTAPAETAPPAEEDTAAAPPTASDNVPTTAPGGGQVYGAQHADSRISIVAKVDTWVRIESATGKAYISRNVKAGDTYKAPNVPGLLLVARDAGSLDLIVDGKPVGAAGPAGTVLTGMPLNPQFLLNRNQGQQ